MRTSRRRSSNPKRARSSRLAKASEAKLELNEKNFIFRSDELQKKIFRQRQQIRIGCRRTDQIGGMTYDDAEYFW